MQFAEDIKELREYLNENGVQLSDKLIDKLYRQYSEEYWAAGWMNIHVAGMNNFLNWLKEEVL